jgi:hypothetical protein
MSGELTVHPLPPSKVVSKQYNAIDTYQPPQIQSFGVNYIGLVSSEPESIPNKLELDAQERKIRQNDQEADKLLLTVSNIRSQVIHIDDELRNQLDLLDESQNSMDHTGNRFERVIDGLKQFNAKSRKGTGGKWIIILTVLLMIVIIILIAV